MVYRFAIYTLSQYIPKLTFCYPLGHNILPRSLSDDFCTLEVWTCPRYRGADILQAEISAIPVGWKRDVVG